MSDKAVLSGLKLAVIGAGNMGGAIVGGLVEKSVYPQNISIFDVDKKKMDAIRKNASVKLAKSSRQCVSLADVVILSVKPQILQQAVAEFATGLGPQTLVISVAAGVPIHKIESYLKKPMPVIRVMPNMPALAGAGMSAFSLGRHATAKHRKIAEAILRAIGEAEQVPERLLDAVTAISGSGPAYF